MNKLSLLAAPLLSLLLVAGCSDNGDTPTNNSGGGGGGGNNPTVALSGDLVATEGATASFTVTLSEAPEQDVTFTVAVNNLSAAANDYTSPAGSVTIDSGVVSGTIDIPITDDATQEASELFQVTLSNVTGGTLGAASSIVRIQPSDGGTDVSFSGTVQTIFQTNCNACHGGSNTNGGFNMGAITATSVRNASGDHGPVMVIGLGNQSNIYLKTTETPPFGDRMPRFGPYLSVGQQEAIRDWISQGAQDN